MNTCFFIGHRDAPVELMPKLEEAILTHITQHGVTTFIVGHYGNFDHMAAQAVIKAKEKYRSITLFRLLPYRTESRMEYLPEGFNGVFCPFDKPISDSAAIPVANKYAINHCDYLIAHVCHEGNSKGFFEYAQTRSNLTITNLV